MPANNQVLSISQEGTLQWRRNSDREQFCKMADLSQTCACKSDDLCRIPLEIWINKANRMNEPPVRIPLTVCLRDVNDNPPQLPRHIDREIPENSKVPYRISLPSATDDDSPKHSKHKYSISCGPNTNFISLKNPSSGKELELLIRKPLDYEKRSSIECSLKACETPFKQCVKSKVMIKVIDQNDNAPIWAKNKWMVTVKENTLVNSPIAELKAHDLDSTFSELRYSLTNEDLQSYFSIEPRSGVVRLANYLDYEALPNKQFLLVVKVTDNGVPQPKSATGTLTITVQDVNDNPPRIELQKNVVSIPENKAEVYLGFMSVWDADKTSNGELTCHISDHHDKFELRSLSTSALNHLNYDIYSITGFDHELKSRVNVRITCSDRGKRPLTSTAVLTVLIEDIDDNDVQFDKRTFAVGLPEDSLISTFVTQLVASDKDSSSVLEFYLLEKEHEALLQLDRTSGRVLTHTMFDREHTSEYSIPVGVRESGNHAKNDSAVLVLKILDVNDNQPTFNRSFSFQVSEGAKINSVIGHVEAFDPDQGVNGSIVYTRYKRKYRISHRSSTFLVDRNGAVRIFQKLDYERTKVHHLVVYAHDQGSTMKHTGSTTVVISVLDENDNPPRFQRRFVSQKITCNGVISVKQECEVHDNDTDLANTKMEYRMIYNGWSSLPGDLVGPKKAVTMDNMTGDVSVMLDPAVCKKQANKIFKVKVQVRDPTKLQFRDECTINIKLEPFPGQKPPNFPMNPNDNQNSGYNSKPRTQSDGDNNNMDRNNGGNGRYNNGFGGYDDDDSYRNDLDGGNDRNGQEFDSSIFLIIILIALSLLLIVLLTCVAFMAKRCRQEQAQEHDELSKMDPDVVNCAPNHPSIQKFNRYSAKNKQNNANPVNTFTFPIRPPPEFQMLPNHQILPDAALTINSLLSDPSNLKSNMSSCTTDDPKMMNNTGINLANSQVDISIGVPSSVGMIESPSMHHKSLNMTYHQHQNFVHNSSTHDYQPLHTAVSYANSKTPVVSTSFV